MGALRPVITEALFIEMEPAERGPLRVVDRLHCGHSKFDG